MVPVKKPPPGSLSVNTVGTPPTGGSATAGSTPNIFASATATPKSMINTTGESSAVFESLQIVYLQPAWLVEDSKIPPRIKEKIGVKDFLNTKTIRHCAAVLCLHFIFKSLPEQKRTEGAAPAHSFMISQ